jgi:hypothetical protein
LVRYPSVKDLERKRKEDQTKEVEGFCKKHGCLIRQEDNLVLYRFISSRNNLLKKSHPDLADRLNKVVATYCKAGNLLSNVWN